jgi:hypothetical protein
MRSRGRILMALGAMLAIPVTVAGAQQLTCMSRDDALVMARRYAPVLSFGPGERYFPTIPFFPAFDGIGRPSNFSDTAKVSAALTETGEVSWSELDKAYQARIDTLHRQIAVYQPKASAVFYRVRCLEGRQPKQLWGFLRNDNVALKRTGLNRLYEGGLKDAEFAVVEYYLYYIRDAGLQGHPHDIERIFVFVPRLGNSFAAERTESLEGHLRIVVGTGHSTTTPNNILVLVNEQVETLRNPAFLIELGGHSSAPDLDRDNYFQPGLDINWNLSTTIWGTRDIQAVAASRFLGDYQAVMAFPRGPCTATLLVPRGLSPTAISASQRKQESGSDDFCERVNQARVEFRPVEYALLPVIHFEHLNQQAERIRNARNGADSSAIVQDTRETVQAIRGLLAGTTWGFAGFRDSSDAAVLGALRAVHRWGSVTKPAGTRIWGHNDYSGSPIRVFKRRIYRPTARGLQNVGDYVSLFYPSYRFASGQGVRELHAGVVLPALALVAIPGVLELQAGRAWNDRVFSGESRLSWSVLFERQYRSLLSWYVRPLDFVSRRTELEGLADGKHSEFAAAAGFSLMPFYSIPDLNPVTHFLSNRLRIRAGVRVDIADWRPNGSRFEIQTVLYAR